ncbi:hypothetical protein BH762_gp043 [Gordonia phage OneUp]|uniref:Uncharacterized protein n=1 Tax=Gordonia phage OneUp TaxID=1838074 RepID=A0A160DF09_9CAUD|nr:hypothetical protein BH762_gp043 [Gordonia phage OneUp]ANA86475.1 hypothetical protein PBI_ONEUP_142 [Gordonia phage OneUp]
MILQTALDMHITDQYNEYLEYTAKCDTHKRTVEEWLDPEFQGEGGQVDIAREVGTRVAAEMGEFVSFGVFNNCREHGITVSNAYGWTFCFYEHRNSDFICIEGCPTAEIKSWGPYSDTDKWDILGQANWKEYDSAARQVIAVLNAAVSFDVTRDELRMAAKEAAK